MNRFLTLIIAITLSIGTLNSFAQRNCGTTNYQLYQINENPLLKQKIKVQEIEIQNWIKNTKHSENEVVYVPVIFHVLYNSTTTNISDAQIQSQMEILNNDYSRRNLDTINTPDIFDTLAADIRIQFCFAHQTPDGDWTNGITRTPTTKTTFNMANDEAKFNSKGGVDAWDTDIYLNIWIVPEIIDGGISGILGYAQMPGGNSATDGVVAGYQFIGDIGTASAPFNKGRTLTHEIGHYFNLYHIWGDDFGSCSGSDYVDDTPNQASKNFGCPIHPHVSCSNNGDMFQNYMDYTNDTCMNLFTKGQRDRMLAALNTQRSDLLTSGMCQANYLKKDNNLEFNIFPNPANKQLNIRINNTEIINIQIIDVSGREIFNNQFETSLISINTSELTNGIYFLKIKSDTQIGFKKFIIQQ